MQGPPGTSWPRRMLTALRLPLTEAPRVRMSKGWLEPQPSCGRHPIHPVKGTFCAKRRSRSPWITGPTRRNCRRRGVAGSRWKLQLGPELRGSSAAKSAYVATAPPVIRYAAGLGRLTNLNAHSILEPALNRAGLIRLWPTWTIVPRRDNRPAHEAAQKAAKAAWALFQQSRATAVVWWDQ